MILAIDVGNTNITLGCMDGKKTVFTERLATDKVKTELEYAILFQTALQLHAVRPEDIDGAIIGSVVPQINAVIREALRKVCPVRILTVGPGVKTGLNIRMDDPTSVGADLIAGAVGAMDRYPCPLVIIDMGTATTMAVVDANRTYIGGLITAGVRISLDSLVSGTAMLQGISLDAPKRVIARNTADALRSGILYGNVAMLDGMLDRIGDELGSRPTVVATGGWAAHVVPYCRHEISIEDDLVLHGLSLIYGRNA